jgi:hypothetical protein
VQVGADLGDHSTARPQQVGGLKLRSQPGEVHLEAGQIHQPAMHFLRSHLIGDGRLSQALALGLGEGDQVHAALDQQLDRQRLTGRQPGIDRRVDVQQLVTCLEAGRQLSFSSAMADSSDNPATGAGPSTRGPWLRHA